MLPQGPPCAPYRAVRSSSEDAPREFRYCAPAHSLTLSALVVALPALISRLFSRRPAAAPPRDVVLRVEHGGLSVVRDATSLVLELNDLLDVELDTRAIEKSQGHVRPDGIIVSGQSLSLDISRIVLVVRDGPFPLSDAYASYGETLEWMGKLRHFLRRHGWVPVDERAA